MNIAWQPFCIQAYNGLIGHGYRNYIRTRKDSGLMTVDSTSSWYSVNFRKHWTIDACKLKTNFLWNHYTVWLCDIEASSEIQIVWHSNCVSAKVLDGNNEFLQISEVKREKNRVVTAICNGITYDTHSGSTKTLVPPNNDGQPYWWTSSMLIQLLLNTLRLNFCPKLHGHNRRLVLMVK